MGDSAFGDGVQELVAWKMLFSPTKTQSGSAKRPIASGSLATIASFHSVSRVLKLSAWLAVLAVVFVGVVQGLGGHARSVTRPRPVVLEKWELGLLRTAHCAVTGSSRPPSPA